jgi:hypothetical protein
VGATLVLTLTGCLGDSGSGSAGSGVQLTAAQVLEKASQKTSAVETYAADLTMNVGTPEGAMDMHGTARFRTKPSTAFTMTIDKMTVGGRSLPTSSIQMIYLDKVIYVKMPQLTQASSTAKPWVKVDLTQAGQQAGLNLDSLLNSSKQADPAEQTKMFTASKDVREVGKETIDGVKTTHYTGSITVAEAMGKLDAQTRQQLQKIYNQIGATKINFDLWADSQQLPRKLSTKVNVQQGTMTSTIVYRDYGKPVSVSAPPADQVGDLQGLTGH